MTKAEEILEKLRENNAKVYIANGEVRITGNLDIPRSLEKAVSEHKVEIAIFIYKHLRDEITHIATQIDVNGRNDLFPQYVRLLTQMGNVEKTIPNQEMKKLFPYLKYLEDLT